MKQSFIDFIADNYWDSRICTVPKNIKEEEALYVKYIRPEIKKDAAVGNDMEACYFEAISSWQNIAFKEGFKAGAAMMAECLVK